MGSHRRYLFALGLLTAACTSPPVAEAPASPEVETPAKAWAIAIHGGAGVLPEDAPAERIAAYEEALRSALTLGRDRLERGDTSLDVVEAVVRFMEDQPQFNAGKGAVFTNAGTNELDAAIMDGQSHAAGAVTGVTTVKNPIGLARKVMAESRHVFLAGAGAEAFADQVGVERVDPSYFFTQRRWDSWQQVVAREKEADEADGARGTVGAVALDRHGNLAAATSTGGLTNKRFGRIGDTPVIGAGTWADNATCAVSGTGLGEQFIRHTVARDISARMAYGGQSLADAAHTVIHDILDPGDGGIIAVSAEGQIAMLWNGNGMFRGAADADGRFDIGIWE